MSKTNNIPPESRIRIVDADLSAQAERRRSRIKNLVYLSATFAIAIGLLALWQIIYSAGWVTKLVLPAPIDVLHALIHGYTTGGWAHHAWVTVMESAVAFVCGVATALFIGAVFAYVDVIRKSCYPFVLLAQTFPKIAIAPLLLTWLGYGYASKIVIGALLAFFPVFVNTVAGLKAVDEGQVDLFRSMRATPWQEFRLLRFPRSLSYIFASLTVAVVVSILGVVVGEFVGAQAGLGYLIIQLNVVGNIAGVYAVLVSLSTVAMLSYGVLYLVQYIVNRRMGNYDSIR